MRLTLIQVCEDAYQFICSHHHLLLDGLCSCYLGSPCLTKRSASVKIYLNALVPIGTTLPGCSSRTYPSLRDSGNSSLCTCTDSLVVDRPPNSLVSQEESYAEQQIQLSAAATAALQSLARQHQLTLNTWCRASGLCFCLYSSQKDVVLEPLPLVVRALVGCEYMIGFYQHLAGASAPQESLPWLK